jgi:hypothetical protein
MYGFFMNMHEKLPASLSKTEREYQLNANKIFKQEIRILSTLKSRLEEIMPDELLLIISTNVIATPPSEHGSYIPDVTNEEMAHILSLNNPSFVDLKTLESPYYRPLIFNVNGRKPQSDYNFSLYSPFNYNFEIRYNNYTPIEPLIRNENMDNDYELVDIYGEEG